MLDLITYKKYALNSGLVSFLLQQSKHCKFYIFGKDHRKNLV